MSTTISRNGDLAYKMYMEIVLKKGSTASYFPAEAFLSQVELEIGGTRIDMHYNDWYRVYSELFRKAEEKTAYRRMTDFVDGEAPGTLKRFYMPLTFYFCKVPGVALPLIALTLQGGKVSYPRDLSSYEGTCSCDLSTHVLCDYPDASHHIGLKADGDGDISKMLEVPKARDGLKQCVQCNLSKPTGDFHKRKDRFDGLQPKCKVCRKTDTANYKERQKANDANRYQANREQILSYCKRYTSANKERISARNKSTRQVYYDKFLRREAAQADNHKRYVKQRRQNDPLFRLTLILRAKMPRPLMGQPTSLIKLVGCSTVELKAWLRFRFSDKMTWVNMGSYWEVDHILPVSAFNLLHDDDKALCFHWTNLQPLAVRENRSKSNKIMPHYFWNKVITVDRFLRKDSYEHLRSPGYQTVRESIRWLKQHVER